VFNLRMLIILKTNICLCLRYCVILCDKARKYFSTMEIKDIKSKLTLEQVLTNYNLKPKNNMLRCPFHEDQTASLQVNYQQNKYKCHACDKKGDVIQFVQDYEKLSKHEALVKCASLINVPRSQNANVPIKTNEPTHEKISDVERTTFLEKMFLSFRKGLLCSDPAKDYCQSRNLDFDKLEIGFNSGQFHHGARKDEKLINDCLNYGLLTLAGTNSRTGGQAYKPFGNKCILFPLKNKENQIVSFYFRSIINNENAKHFYLKNRQGLYPNYPHPDTKKLILTEAIIDTASLLQIDEIKANYTLLTCYGTNGLNEEILNAIKDLKQLDEVIFFFDGDKAGKEAIKKYANQLKLIKENIKITRVETPENEDINSLIIGHETNILSHLIEKRTSFFSTEELDPINSEQTNLKLQTKEPTNAIDFLKQDNLIQNLNHLIGRAGIVGEENSRMLLFLIIISYLNKNPITRFSSRQFRKWKNAYYKQNSRFNATRRCIKIYKNYRKFFIQLGRI
jgi:DNA primase